MESRFVVPVIVSTALHALVFLIGSDSARVPPAPPAGPTPTSVVPFVPSPPIEEVEPVPADSTEPARGEPASYRPMIDEPPPSISVDGPTFTPAPRPAADGPIVDHIPSLLPGLPDGIGNGPINSSIISSKFLDDPPRTRSQIAPVYPSEAKSSGLTGEVVVEFVVDETGRVLNPHVVRATDTRFEHATLRAVERWRFEPGKKNGHPVRFRMAVPVVFSLDN